VAERQDSAENRTEEATPRRRAKAREEGRIARSTELAAAAILLGGTAVLATFGGSALGDATFGFFRRGPSWLLIRPDYGNAVSLLREVGLQALLALLPFLGGLAVVALGVGLAQTRGLASWKPLRPDLSRLSPAAGFRRILGAEAGLNLVKSALKLVTLGFVTYLVLRRSWPRFGDLADAAPFRVFDVLRGASLELAATVGLTFLAMGLLDFVVQRFRYERGLRMTRYEVLREFKEQEGDPQIKARIRQIARQRARQRMLSQVARADVVVTNPTHLAVALKYDPLASAAPVVLAMGERKLAERIKLLALRAGVPLVENRPLARALLKTGKVGAPIPAALYVAVAEILAYVYRRRGRMPSAVARAAERSVR
jgi:flagellar biosynthetic protein FlhB